MSYDKDTLLEAARFIAWMRGPEPYPSYVEEVAVEVPDEPGRWPVWKALRPEWMGVGRVMFYFDESAVWDYLSFMHQKEPKQ